MHFWFCGAGSGGVEAYGVGPGSSISITRVLKTSPVQRTHSWTLFTCLCDIKNGKHFASVFKSVSLNGFYWKSCISWCKMNPITVDLNRLWIKFCQFWKKFKLFKCKSVLSLSLNRLTLCHEVVWNFILMAFWELNTPQRV